MRESPIYEQLLAELLSESSDLGARLKQRLNAASIARGLGNFDHSALGYRSFSDFLKRGHGGIVDVAPPAGSGDVLVSLKDSYRDLIRALKPSSDGDAVKPTSSGPAVRNAVWQAFCNPDMNRKRFLHLPSAAVRHFTADEGMPADMQSNTGDYLEIAPITGLQQTQWMQSFLGTLELTPDEAEALEVIISEPYSSSMNAAFTQALGEHGSRWRRLRTMRVHEIIRQWAEANQVPLLKLYTPLNRENERSAPHLQTAPSAGMGARQKAQQLLEVLSDDDVARLVIPTILNAILNTTQR